MSLYCTDNYRTEEQLAETLSLVEDQDQRCLTQKADARDLAAMNELADRAMSEFGHIDILIVNHGLWTVAENSWVLEEDVWQENIDVMLTGGLSRSDPSRPLDFASLPPAPTFSQGHAERA